MQYTEILYLISKTESKDEIGNIIFSEQEKKVYAKKNKVGSKEFYNAAAVGIVPTAELQIKLSNYNGETEVKYNERRYSVIRTVPINRMDIILVIGIKQGANNIATGANNEWFFWYF